MRRLPVACVGTTSSGLEEAGGCWIGVWKGRGGNGECSMWAWYRILPCIKLLRCSHATSSCDLLPFQDCLRLRLAAERCAIVGLWLVWYCMHIAYTHHMHILYVRTNKSRDGEWVDDGDYSFLLLVCRVSWLCWKHGAHPQSRHRLHREKKDMPHGVSLSI